MKQIFYSLLIAATNGDNSGCWKEIPNAIVESIKGSSGFTVDCPTTGGPLAASMVVTRHKRPFRPGHHPMPISLIQRSAPVSFRDPPLQVCMQASDSATEDASPGFVDIKLSSQYVIRGAAIYDGATGGYATPSQFTLNMRSQDDQTTGVSEWYSSLMDQDSGAPWTPIISGVMDEFGIDLAGSYVKIFPKSTTASKSLSGSGFGIKLMGCPVDQTSVISFRFKSSKKSIIQRFGHISSFINDLTNYVCLMTRLSSSPSPCPRLVYADLQEQSAPNPDFTPSTAIQPDTIPTVEVFFRILPSDPYTCNDCRSAQVIQSDLQTDLLSPTSYGSNILKSIDVWIEDPDPYTCYAKTCPEGSLCVDGVCVTPLEIWAQKAAGQQLEEKIPFTSSDDIDKLLNTPMLQVIPGVDTSRGMIVFSNTVAPAGSASTPAITKSASESITGDDSGESFLQRFMIPIIVVSTFTAIIIGLIIWKFFNRTQSGSQPATSGGI